MFHRLRNLFRRDSSANNQVVSQPVEPPVSTTREVVEPLYLFHGLEMPPPTSGIRYHNPAPLVISRSTGQELPENRSTNPNPQNEHNQALNRPVNINTSRDQHNRRTDQLTPKQIERMISRDSKLINEFAVLTSGTAILAYNAASVPGFTLDPCMIQSSATLLGGLFFLYYTHISDARYKRYFDNRLVKVGIFCITLSCLSILINVITAALNYNSRFWVISSSTSICVVSNSINSTSTTNSLSIRNHSNILFVLCYLSCLLISLLPFLRLLIIVLDAWYANNHNEDRQAESARETERLHAAQREAFEANTRLELQLNNRTDQIGRLEEQLTSIRHEVTHLREAHAHHCADGRTAALDLAHRDGSCHHVHIPRTTDNPAPAEPPISARSARTANTDNPPSYRVSFQ